jgi:ubiquinone/menaquinone biosynthesis C-methylase UbiE
MLTSYGALCTEVYDLTKPVGGSHPLIDYHLRCLAGTRGRILEAGVGTGRVLIPLLEAGLLVDGVDRSEHMLASCRRNCATRNLSPTLYQANLETMDLPERYEAILITGASFMLVDKREAAEATLRNFARHLVPGGRLYVDLDVMKFQPVDLIPSTRLSAVTGADGSTITIETTTQYDFVEQVMTLLMRYQRLKEGRPEETELEELSLRWYGQYEFASLLAQLGFSSIQLCADYVEGRKPTPQSWRFCFVATRP